jgi:hypothetical protein
VILPTPMLLDEGRIDTPARRMAGLQTASHNRLRLLGAIDMRKAGALETRTIYAQLARKHESEIHRMFQSDRLHGEWFALTPVLRDFIERECNAHLTSPDCQRDRQ